MCFGFEVSEVRDEGSVYKSYLVYHLRCLVGLYACNFYFITLCRESFSWTNVSVDYSIVRIKIKSRKRAGDISGRAETGI